MTETTTSTQRPPAATAVGVLAVLGAIGAIVMSLAHLDLAIPLVAALGPTGRALPAVAAGFAVGAGLFAAVAYGAFARTAWAWPAALVVNGLALASATMPWRGIESSGVPALVTLVALGVLLSRPGRDALPYRGRRG